MSTFSTKLTFLLLSPLEPTECLGPFGQWRRWGGGDRRSFTLAGVTDAAGQVDTVTLDCVGQMGRCKQTMELTTQSTARDDTRIVKLHLHTPSQCFSFPKRLQEELLIY